MRGFRDLCSSVVQDHNYVMLSTPEFETRLAALPEIPFREDFETARYDLYLAASAEQRAVMRQVTKMGTLQAPKQWRNPTDYERSDLTREQRMRRHLVFGSISEGRDDFRDDLCSIAYCYHNLALMGIDADQVLVEVAQLSGPRFANLVMGFVRRSSAQKSLKEWHLQVVQTPDGPAVDHTL